MGERCQKVLPSYLVLGLKPEPALYLVSKIRLCLHGTYLLSSTTGMEKSHSQDTGTQAALRIKGQDAREAQKQGG